MNWEKLKGKKWRTCKRLPVLYHLKLCFITLRALIRLSIYFFLVGLFFIFFPSVLVYGVNRRLDWPENKHLYWPGVSALDAG